MKCKTCPRVTANIGGACSQCLDNPPKPTRVRSPILPQARTRGLLRADGVMGRGKIRRMSTASKSSSKYHG